MTTKTTSKSKQIKTENKIEDNSLELFSIEPNSNTQEKEFFEKCNKISIVNLDGIQKIIINDKIILNNAKIKRNNNLIRNKNKIIIELTDIPNIEVINDYEKKEKKRN